MQHTPELHEHADAWHHHSKEEGVPQPEHGAIAKTSTIFGFFIALTASIGVLVLVVSLFFTYNLNNRRTTFMEGGQGHLRIIEPYQSYRGVSEGNLGIGGQPGTYGWADDASGKVRIPLDQAMSKVQKQYEGQGK